MSRLHDVITHTKKMHSCIMGKIPCHNLPGRPCYDVLNQRKQKHTWVIR